MAARDAGDAAAKRPLEAQQQAGAKGASGANPPKRGLVPPAPLEDDEARGE